MQYFLVTNESDLMSEKGISKGTKKWEQVRKA